MRVHGQLKQLTQFRKTKMSSLFMNVPYTRVSTKKRWVLFRGKTALSGKNGTYSSTSYNMDCSDRTTLMVLLISTCTWTCSKTDTWRNRKHLVLRTMCDSNRMGHWHITHLLLGNIFVRLSVIVNSPWAICFARSTCMVTHMPRSVTVLGVPKM